MFNRILFLCLAYAFVVFAAEDPVATIQKKDGELQTLLKKSKHSTKEMERVKTLLSEGFDFELLAKKSLSKKDWESQDKSLQDKFVQEFKRMVRNSSAKRLELYKADSTIYEPAKVKKENEAKVVAHLWNGGKEAILEYKMSLVDGKWKAWDLVIDDLSTARNYKDQFSQILKTKTFDELIDIISKKADETEK